MRYQGSKAKLAKGILPIITENLKEDTWYIEPFVGGCNMFDKVEHEKKIGLDLNKHVISMWKYFQDGGLPPKDVSLSEYSELKRLSKLESIDESKSWLIGYVGNACSYGCSWFNGYAKYNPNKKENHILEAYNGTVKQLAKFKNFKESEFICSDYENFDYPKNSVIYCDPPYQSTKKYASDFDHERFWDWVRKMSTEGHHVYVSEYTAPEDFKCVWSKERSDGMGTYGFGEKQAKKVEKLFVYSK